VTTQPVTKQVPVEREEIVVEREVSAKDEAGR
jgi:stress response protein YsnF